MTTVDPGVAASYETAIALVGVPVWFQRQLTFAPAAATFSPSAAPGSQSDWPLAAIRNFTPNTTQTAATDYPASKWGSIPQGDRAIVVMAADLEAAGFPLPVQKEDQVILGPTGETVTVTRVDAFKRALAGAIEVTATGV